MFKVYFGLTHNNKGISTCEAILKQVLILEEHYKNKLRD